MRSVWDLKDKTLNFIKMENKSTNVDIGTATQTDANTVLAAVTWKILDKDGIEMPDDWAVTPRTYERVKRLLDRLNVNGEYRPYTMVQK